MNDLANLLAMSNVKRAAIIDDAFEPVPLAKDMSLDEKSWVQFFEDLNDDDRKIITSQFLDYDKFRADELRANDLFVATLWVGRSKLRKEIINPLFDRYDQDRNQDLAYLETLKEAFKALGIECQTAGRDFSKVAETADLIVIDLYLGSMQDDEAMQCSIDGLLNVIKQRMARPPLVILMSRSPRLEENRKSFRDKSGLFESAFRIIRKADLAGDGKFSRILTRLAEHYSETVKLASFLTAWQSGLNNACSRTADLIRTLDLADHAQIHQLLLTDEGEPPGSYLVDVFDLVLQHEVEREHSIIDAAIQLNGLNSATYPPPYVSGSPDLQALVYRSLFHNNERLRLRNPSASPLVFGEILRRKSGVAFVAGSTTPTAEATLPIATTIPVDSALVAVAAHVAAPVAPVPNVAVENETLKNVSIPFSEMTNDDVFVVLTPACDLQRGTKRVVLLKGTLIPLTSANWLKNEPTTAVFESLSGQRFQIKWDLKHIESVSAESLDEILKGEQGFEIIGRLREAPALELQQKLLSSLGRVGLIAAMPATFPIKIEAYLPNPEGKLIKIDVPAISKNDGVCFIGRKENEDAKTLVLCEDACEALCEAVQTMNPDTIHPVTRETVLASRTTGDLLALQKGIDFLGVTDVKFKDISIPVPAKDDKPAGQRAIGLIRKKGGWIDDPLTNGGVLKKAGIILAVTEP